MKFHLVLGGKEGGFPVQAFKILKTVLEIKLEAPDPSEWILLLVNQTTENCHVTLIFSFNLTDALPKNQTHTITKLN